MSVYKQTEEPRQLEFSLASLFHFPVALVKENWHDMPVNRCQTLCFLSRMKGAEAGKQGKVKSLEGEAKQVSTNLKGADLNKQGQWGKPSLHGGGAQVALR